MSHKRNRNLIYLEQFGAGPVLNEIYFNVEHLKSCNYKTNFKEIMKGYFWNAFNSFIDWVHFFVYMYLKKYFQTWLAFGTRELSKKWLSFSNINGPLVSYSTTCVFLVSHILMFLSIALWDKMEDIRNLKNVSHNFM